MDCITLISYIHSKGFANNKFDEQTTIAKKLQTNKKLQSMKKKNVYSRPTYHKQITQKASYFTFDNFSANIWTASTIWIVVV